MRSVGGLFGQALVFGTAPALQKLASLLLLPYFTHYLHGHDYGEIELIAFWTSVFVVAFGCEYRAGMLWRFTTTTDAGARRCLFTASTYFTAVTAVLAGGAFAALGPWLLASQMGSPPAGSLLLVLAGGVTFDLLGVVWLTTMQAEQRATRLVSLSLVQFTVDAALKIEFVAREGRGVEGYFLASTIASAISASLAFASVRGLWLPRVDAAAARREIAAVLHYAAPVLLGSGAYLLVRRVDRPLLVDALGLAAVGVYGRAARLTQLVLDFYVVPFQRSFDVWRLSVHAARQALTPVADVYRWFMLGAGLVATGVATFGCDLFTSLADPGFLAVREQVPLLNVSVLCQCAATIVASAFFVTQRTGTWMQFFFLGLAIEVVMLLAGVRWLGIPGVALALASAHGFLWWAAAHFGRRLWPVPYRHGQALAIVALATGLSLARPELPAGPVWLALGIDTLLVLAYLALALPVARVGRAELAMLWHHVRRRSLRR